MQVSCEPGKHPSDPTQNRNKRGPFSDSYQSSPLMQPKQWAMWSGYEERRRLLGGISLSPLSLSDQICGTARKKHAGFMWNLDLHLMPYDFFSFNLFWFPFIISLFLFYLFFFYFMDESEVSFV